MLLSVTNPKKACHCEEERRSKLVAIALLFCIPAMHIYYKPIYLY
jgi:hypothetical protein